MALRPGPLQRCLAYGSLEAAKFTKLAETAYRDVNIALANEFAQPAVQPSPSAGHIRRRPLHPRIPQALSNRQCGSTHPRRGAGDERRLSVRAVRLLAELTGGLSGLQVAVSFTPLTAAA